MLAMQMGQRQISVKSDIQRKEKKSKPSGARTGKNPTGFVHRGLKGWEWGLASRYFVLVIVKRG
jgi:hypothetical protein